MNPEQEQYKKGIEDDLKAYKKLEKINNSDEFNDFFNLQVDTASKKIMTAFTGDGPKDWDAFCKLRGEVVGILYPMQQIRGAKAVQAQLKEQLNTYYNTEA